MSKENLDNVVLTILSKSKAELIYYPCTSKNRKTPREVMEIFTQYRYTTQYKL
jgi:hypothetical protein